MDHLDPTRLVEPHAYKTQGYPHAEWAALRAEDPVSFLEVDGWPPFWALTKYRDIVEVAAQPRIFSNEQGIALERERERSASVEASRQMRSIVNMDPPRHTQHRQVAMPWFTQEALERLLPVVRETARRLVDGLGAEGEGDLVDLVAAPYPVHVVATLLGVPPEDEPFLLDLTREMLGREDLAAGETPEDDVDRNRQMFFEFFSYYSRLIEERRKKPRDDLSTTFANARIEGKPMGRMETLAYGLVTATAGHDTTRSAVAGGLLALLEHPRAFETWQRKECSTDRAADEVLRFVSPVTYMMRTATEDYVLRGKRIRRGDRVVLFFASGNRDEEIFVNPNDLDLDRFPNRHLALGTGEHFCLGSRLARAMSGILLEELVTRFDMVELAGAPERTASNMIPSVSRLPLRYRVRRAAE